MKPIIVLSVLFVLIFISLDNQQTRNVTSPDRHNEYKMIIPANADLFSCPTEKIDSTSLTMGIEPAENPSNGSSDIIQPSLTGKYYSFGSVIL